MDLNEELIKRLKQARNNAEESTRIKDKYVAYISYELRTLLTAVTGFSHMLQETRLDLVQKKYIDTIVDSSEILNSLLDVLLDHDKIISGDFELENQAFDISALFEEIFAIASRKKTKTVDFVSDMQVTKPIVVKGDSLHLCQVLLNLIDNAFYFTQQGEVKLKFSLEDRSDEKTRLNVVVSDTGCGIAENEIEHIFDPFYKINVSSTHRYKGPGIGLTIVKKILDKMGATIHCSSQLDKGTEFRIQMQFNKSDADSEIQSPNLVRHKDYSYFKRTDVKILFVDDNYAHSVMACEVLARLGLLIDTADSALKAIEMLKKNSYDVVLMDIMMPEIDGIMATKKIREDLKSDVPIIAVSAATNQEDIDKALNSGMSEYVTKPIDFDKLIGMMANLVKY